MCTDTPTIEEGLRRLKRLSMRERDVFDLAVAGMSRRDIATYMGITISTVSVHLHHVSGKLGVRTVVQLLLFAAVHGVAPSVNNATTPAPVLELAEAEAPA